MSNIKSTNTETVDIDFRKILLNPIKNCLKENLPAFNFWINPLGKRNHKNCHYITGLVLDIDGGWLINECIAELGHLHFYLYTTSTHTNEKHKFRFIIPFENPIPRSEYTDDTITGLLKLFPKCDPCTFSFDRYFYLPSASEIYYIRFNQDGKYFDSVIDLAQLTAFEERLRIKRKSMPTMNVKDIIRSQSKDITTDIDQEAYIKSMEDKTEKEIKDIINRGNDTGRYADILSAIGRGKRRNVDPEKIYNFLTGYHKQKDLRTLCRK
jgi:hypothetical protein